MKTIIISILFAFASVASAQDVHFSKKELLDMIGPEMAPGICTQNLMDCLDLSQAACNAEIGRLLVGSCAGHVPEGGAGGDAIGEIAGKFSHCVVADLLAAHKNALKKNAMTPACQSIGD